MSHDDLRKAARDAFKRLAREAGLKPQFYELRGEWIKDDANRLHIVQSYGGDGALPVVLKLALRPQNAEEFAAIMAAHKRAMRALDGAEGVTVPQILAEDAGAQAYLMTFQEGETLLNLCRSAEDHAPYLRAAGQWLSAFHEGTFQEDRQFRPRFMAGHMQMLAEQVETGARKIRGGKKFVRYARQVPDLAKAYRGRDSKVAGKHGDLNAHNILIGNEVAAYDFLPKSDAPVGYDIARLLVSYMQMVGDIDAIPKGDVLPPEALEAFFEGYSLVGRDDPGVQFMLRVQVLTDWNRMHPKMTAQSLIRYARVKAIARQAFG